MKMNDVEANFCHDGWLSVQEDMSGKMLEVAMEQEETYEIPLTWFVFVCARRTPRSSGNDDDTKEKYTRH